MNEPSRNRHLHLAEAGRRLPRVRRWPRLAAVPILLAAGSSPAPAAPDPGSGTMPPGERVVAYEIQARLDRDAKTIHGRERVSWTNPSGVPVGEMRLHLYLNGFKNDSTSFMKESAGRSRGNDFKKGGWGWIEVEELSLAGGGDLLAGAEFIRPDDGNLGDETVMRVPLPEPVPPGGTLTFDAVFTSKLPQVFARTGYRNEFYLVAQWFPKLGVFEPAGMRGRAEPGWNCHQFHAHTEFYADFGGFDVTITVPSGYVVGATGALAEPPRTQPDGTTAYRYVQEGVHDFAWTADPGFIAETRPFVYARERDPVEERRMARILGLDASRIPERGEADLSGVPEALRLGDVEVRLLLQPEHRGLADRHFDAAFKALAYYGYWFGRYPYATLTIVDPAYGAAGAGGMEYPTLITAGARYVAPALKQRPEGVTVHETGHQFWYGLVANNEFEEAWLDEGINSYATGKVMEKIYGPDHETMDIFGASFIRYPLMSLPLDPAESAAPAPGGPADRLERAASLRWAGAGNDPLLNVLRDLPFLTFPRAVGLPAAWSRRGRYLAAPSSDVMVRPSWEYYDGSSYARNAYDKSVLSLRTLETIIGEDAVARALRLFHQKWRFRHPSTSDFVETVNAVTGRDMSWYFDQILHGSGVLDYEIASVAAKRRSPAGIFGSGAGRREVTPKEAKEAGEGAGDGAWEMEVAVRRLGEVRLPVEIELIHDDGRRETRAWDGQDRWMRIREAVDGEIAQARILPAAGRPLDAVWFNDARTAKASRWPALKWWTRLVGWAQQVLYFYSGIA